MKGKFPVHLPASRQQEWLTTPRKVRSGKKPKAGNLSFHRRRKDSKAESHQMDFERRESLLTGTLVFLIEFAYRVPQKSEKLVKDLTLL